MQNLLEKPKSVIYITLSFSLPRMSSSKDRIIRSSKRRTLCCVLWRLAFYSDHKEWFLSPCFNTYEFFLCFLEKTLLKLCHLLSSLIVLIFKKLKKMLLHVGWIVSAGCLWKVLLPDLTHDMLDWNLKGRRRKHLISAQ